ncbi:molybdopterin molybdotransferase MoeA [Alisedimentitalea sp. MJ-SS2]|uniref:molybdopterin molybdotransferase MoeA n=1 Tax=Aliisedimentitalea sp. MJ-SS2 TaxID=3049795 RepID=UPI0029126A3A|nr:gephyrin-like molybdotransferase Glp [Alisedimentitalea sp. MJ-SS2]MDU8929740.1 molybdopterin molybdotransferase MoeA [Alisedimentitalea sp. MJ-SS2]
MISVDEALGHLFSLTSPLEVETVPLIEAAGRVLAQPVRAGRNQPPFSASAMDGYAIIGDEADLHAQFKVIGESAAGHGFDGTVKPGTTVRIFTGAPVPEGATHVVIQEDVERRGDLITITAPQDGHNIRALGNDFRVGDAVDAPCLLSPEDVALLAAMNFAEVPVTRRPVVALISTGDELVMPGETPGPDQIIASNTFGLHALLSKLGAEPRLLPIARDNRDSLETTFKLAEGADLIVTIGGASVGDHDLVGDVAEAMGMERAFYKIAMRPGKPLMAGRMGDAVMVGLPGNPVSAMVCGHIFLAPMIRAFLGLGTAPTPARTARLTRAMGPNGPRQHYQRALVDGNAITVFNRQDSSLLSVLSRANALAISPPHAEEMPEGSDIAYIPF